MQSSTNVVVRHRLIVNWPGQLVMSIVEATKILVSYNYLPTKGLVFYKFLFALAASPGRPHEPWHDAQLRLAVHGRLPDSTDFIGKVGSLQRQCGKTVF